MVIILPFIACAMSMYAITGEIITSSIEILLLTVRQKCFHLDHLRHLTIQTLCMQLTITILLWISLAVNHYAVHSSGRFINSAYYSMVTISTVGFGDYPWKSEEFLDASFVYLLSSMFLFLFSLGTFAASITQVNKLLTETATKNIKQKLLQKKKITRPEKKEEKQMKYIEDNNNNNNNNKQCACSCHHQYERIENNHNNINAYVNHLF